MDEAVAARISKHRAREQGRGREARKPTQIPARGWKDVFWRVKDEVSDDRLGTIAAGTAFFVLLAIFPALAAIVSVYGLVADPATIEEHMASFAGYVPADMLNLLRDQLHNLAASGGSELGLTFVISLALALWSANSGVKSIFDALNVAYDEEEERGFFKLLAVSMTFTLGSILFVLLLFPLVIGIPIILNFFDIGLLGKIVAAVVPLLVLFGVASFGISMLYRFGPSRAPAKWRWITPGSTVAAFVWILGSALFSWYLSNFASYTATYGSLGAAVGAMMWIYISMFIVLLGAELNSEIEHQTAEDTTTGPDRPLGTRGATMADRIGEARG